MDAYIRKHHHWIISDYVLICFDMFQYVQTISNPYIGPKAPRNSTPKLLPHRSQLFSRSTYPVEP